jgi:hypothetical protein
VPDNSLQWYASRTFGLLVNMPELYVQTPFSHEFLPSTLLSRGPAVRGNRSGGLGREGPRTGAQADYQSSRGSFNWESLFTASGVFRPRDSSRATLSWAARIPR